MEENKSVIIRPMVEEDVKSVLALWKSTDGIYLHSKWEDTFEGITQYISRNPDLSAVAVTGNKIVGAVLCGHEGRRGLIHHLAVDKAYRGKGIGKKLLQICIDKLKQLNIKKCLTFVLKDNSEALSFWDHCEWKREEIAYIYSKQL